MEPESGNSCRIGEGCNHHPSACGQDLCHVSGGVENTVKLGKTEDIKALGVEDNDIEDGSVRSALEKEDGEDGRIYQAGTGLRIDTEQPGIGNNGRFRKHGVRIRGRNGFCSFFLRGYRDIFVGIHFCKSGRGRNHTADGKRSDSAPKIDGLTYTGTMALQYATCFNVYYYEGGYKLISVPKSGDYLLVPDGKEAPKGLSDDITVIGQPQNIYLAATSAMSLFCALDSLNVITMCGIKADDWTIKRGPPKGYGRRIHYFCRKIQ